MRPRRLQWQLMFSVLAAACVAALSLALILDAVSSAERTVVADAHRSLDAALDELARQYRDRAAADPAFDSLPAEARNLSLRAIAQIVFRSYPDAGGGFLASGQLLGSTIPERGPGGIEPDSQLAIASSSLRNGPASRPFPGTPDLLVSSARPAARGMAVWALKRLPGRQDSSAAWRPILLALLALGALVSVGGALATGIGLRRGVTAIQRGLVLLESDFTYALPPRHDELGQIGDAINRMAATRRQLEAELAREERLRLIGRLAAGVAHEIRNPLNSIRLSLDVLEKRLLRGSLQPAHLDSVRSEVDRLNGLLTDLLLFNQSHQPAPLPQPVAPVLRRCVELLHPQARHSGVQLILESCPDSLHAAFDPHRLIQAVMNLTLNAIQASPPGATVRLSLAPLGSSVRISVRDQGAGLSPLQKQHLFEAFYTTKPNGTGLGLAVSRELVTAMGGSLAHEDSPRGACFVLSLPQGSSPHA